MFKFIIAVIIFMIIVNLFNKSVNTATKLKKSVDENGLLPNIIALCIVAGIFYYVYNSLTFNSYKKTASKQVVSSKTINSLDECSMKIAAISNGFHVVGTHPDAVRSKYLLGRVVNHYESTPEKISDMTVAASQQLAKYRIKRTPLQVLEDMNLLLVETPKGIPYQDILAAYVTIAAN